MIPRDHVRALKAHDHATAVAAEPFFRPYGAHCHYLPVLVHQAGLAPALHHTATLMPAKRRLLGHLAEQLHEAGLLQEPTAAALLAATRGADSAHTRRLTREVQRCLLWSKRFAHSVLSVLPGDDGDKEEGAS